MLHHVQYSTYVHVQYCTVLYSGSPEYCTGDMILTILYSTVLSISKFAAGPPPTNTFTCFHVVKHANSLILPIMILGQF